MRHLDLQSFNRHVTVSDKTLREAMDLLPDVVSLVRSGRVLGSAPVAQRIEQQPSNLSVARSNRAGGTKRAT